MSTIAQVKLAATATKKLLKEEGALVIPKNQRLSPSIQKYRPHLMEDELIINRLAGGETLTKVLSDVGMPGRDVVMRWREANLYNFGERYERARSMQTEIFADQVIDIADDPKIDSRKARVQMDARKWSNAKRAPEKWGDRTIISGDRNNPLTMNVSLDLSELSDTELAALEAFTAARKETLAESKRTTIDVPFEDVSEDTVT